MGLRWNEIATNGALTDEWRATEHKIGFAALVLFARQVNSAASARPLAVALVCITFSLSITPLAAVFWPIRIPHMKWIESRST